MVAKGRMVLIDWLDSRGLTEEWEFREDCPSLAPSKCQTVGFVCEEQADFVTVACTVSADQILGRLTIPKGAILKMRGLRR